MKCADLLVQDHKTILRSLEVLQQIASSVEKGNPPLYEDVVALLHFLRRFADDHHQVKEESALFPELLRGYGAQDAGVRQILFEHDQERSLVEGLEDSLRTKEGADFVHFATRLTALLRNHIYKEENVLFDIVARSLSAEQDQRVVDAFNKFQINPSLMADLRRLEWKYLQLGE